MSKMWMSFAALALMAGCGPAVAQDYPWCARYHDDLGSRNCGFESYAQCMETAQGGGAYCEQNSLYKAPEPEPAAAPEQPAPAPAAAKKPARKKKAAAPAPQ
jgi:hypothetical protein